MGELNVATVTRQPEVLLVDSQDAILQRLHQLLSAHSYVLHLAHDASEALKVMATREVDLIINHKKVYPSKPRCTRKKYLVAWKGYGRELDSWVTDEQIEGSPRLLADYWQKVGNNPDLGTVQEPEAGSNSLQPPGRLDTFSLDEDQ